MSAYAVHASSIANFSITTGVATPVSGTMSSNNLPDPVIHEIPDNVRIVGLGHKAGSGKDTVADILQAEAESQGTTVLRIAFADRLKDAAQVLFDLSVDDVRTQEGKLRTHPFWGVTNRRMLQLFGTECVRKGLHDEFWVLVVLAQIVKAAESGEPLLVLITDVRFPNEANALRQLGGQVWRIDRPSVIDAEREFQQNGGEVHSSETALDGYEHWNKIIVNDGTLEDLEQTVLAAF